MLFKSQFLSQIQPQKILEVVEIFDFLCSIKHVHLRTEDVVSLMKEGSIEWEKYVPDEVGVRQSASAAEVRRGCLEHVH